MSELCVMAAIVFLIWLMYEDDDGSPAYGCIFGIIAVLLWLLLGLIVRRFL